MTTHDLTAITDGLADPDLDNLDLGAEDSDLDQLDAELGAITAATTTLEVPLRPGYSIRCRTDFTGADLEKLRKAARDKRFADGLDGVKFAALLIASNTDAILRQGDPLVLDGVSPVTFTTPELKTRYGTANAADTVRAFFGREGHVDAAARRLTSEAGWGDDLYAVDPTA